jgi:hypothetical protein
VPFYTLPYKKAKISGFTWSYPADSTIANAGAATTVSLYVRIVTYRTRFAYNALTQESSEGSWSGNNVHVTTVKIDIVKNGVVQNCGTEVLNTAMQVGHSGNNTGHSLVSVSVHRAEGDTVTLKGPVSVALASQIITS